MPPKKNFDWQQYIEFAEALSNTSQKNECIMRNIISRSYYGAFCLSREFALKTYRVDADYKNIYPSSNGRTLERDSKFAVRYANTIKNIINDL